MGGQRLSGRWHTASPGKRIVYLSEHPALALIENLSNLRGNPAFYPQTYQLLRISSIDQDVSRHFESLDLHDLTPEMSSNETAHSAQSQIIGDDWLSRRASVLLRIPSIPSPESFNYLFNPLHPDASTLKIDWAKSIEYDKRLFHLNSSY